MKKQKKILSIDEIKSIEGVKLDTLTWYISAAKEIYADYTEIRLTDSQLAKLIVKKYGGKEASILSNIRRTRCNDKSQAYVSKEA